MAVSSSLVSTCSTPTSSSSEATIDLGLGLPNPESNSKGGFSGSAPLSAEYGVVGGACFACWNGRRRFVGEVGVVGAEAGEVGKGGGGNIRAKPRMASETSEEMRPPREGRRAIGEGLDLVGEEEVSLVLIWVLGLVGVTWGAAGAVGARSTGAWSVLAGASTVVTTGATSEVGVPGGLVYVETVTFVVSLAAADTAVPFARIAIGLCGVTTNPLMTTPSSLADESSDEMDEWLGFAACLRGTPP